MTKDLKELINHIKREVDEFYQDHLDDDDTELEIIGDLREWTALVEYIEEAERKQAE
jgi:hypothetical protein